MSSKKAILANDLAGVWQNNRSYRSLLTFNPSALALTWVDSSLRVCLGDGAEAHSFGGEARATTAPSEWKAG